MINSVLQKYFRVTLCLGFSLLFISFKAEPDLRLWLNWSNRTLAQMYDASGDQKLKKCELNITDDYFLRLRKTYQTGKQEYFSCHLSSFGDMTYLGTTTSGRICINTKGEDVIVQTYNDKKGNVDSMARVLTIPVKNIQVEQLDSLQSAFIAFKATSDVR